MALTMSDYDEAEGRRDAAKHGASAMERAWITELDATRARVAELERESEKDRAALARAFTLGAAREIEHAATQAERDKARAALWKVPWPCDCRGDNEGCFHRSAYAVLARPVGSVEALRSLMERAVRAGLAAVGHDDGSLFYCRRETSVQEIVARLLEPRSDTPEADKKGAGE